MPDTTSGIPGEKGRAVRELTASVLARPAKMCNFIEWQDKKVSHRAGTAGMTGTAVTASAASEASAASSDPGVSCGKPPGRVDQRNAGMTVSANICRVSGDGLRPKFSNKVLAPASTVFCTRSSLVVGFTFAFGT